MDADALARARYSELEFNAPMHAGRAAELIASLGPLAGASVVDLGCGWAEFLLRVVADDPTARGVGIDRDPSVIARARENAATRGLLDRLELDCADASQWSGVADVAVVIGSSHAWGGAREALDALRPSLRPGGRVLLGEGVWEQPPTSAALTALDARADDLTTVEGLVDLSGECGYRLLALSTATLDEWDSFESRFCAGRERWLVQNSDAPEAADVRAEVDAHREGWLHGYRGVLGFAYLTLVTVPA